MTGTKSARMGSKVQAGLIVVPYPSSAIVVRNWDLVRGIGYDDRVFKELMSMDETCRDEVVQILLRHFSDLQAVYLFGSYGTDEETAASDLDLAVLLSPDEAESVSSMMRLEVRFALEKALRRDVDLVNLRKVNTVFQHEIIKNNRRIYCADAYAADVFEMLTMSYYQKLNEERAEILEAVVSSGRVLGHE